MREELRGYAEIAVVSCSRGRSQAFRHFLLNEENGARRAPAHGGFDDRRRHVIRQIARDRGAAPEIEVNCRGIRLNDFETALARESAAEILREARVDFD